MAALLAAIISLMLDLAAAAGLSADFSASPILLMNILTKNWVLIIRCQGLWQ